MMKLERLRYFVEAVQCGSISAAAKKVNLAQPAFSLHIKALEDDLNVSLLERSSKGVVVTEAGQRLYQGALSLFRHVEQVREETVNTTGQLAGEVRIVLASSVAPLLAGRLFWRVRRIYPHIRLVILDLLRIASEDLVRSRMVDVALLPNVATLSGGVSEPLLAQDLYLVGREPTGHGGAEIDFRQLAHYPLVMGGRQNQLRIDLENTAARVGFSIMVSIEQDSLSIFKSIVLNGPAYTIVPYSAFAPEIEAGVLTATRIVNPSIERTLSYVWHESSSLSASAQAVMTVLRQEVADMVREGSLRGRVLTPPEGP